MDNNDRRIITPREFMTRQNARAGLVEVNKRLVRELEATRRELAGRDMVINSMNQLFTKIAQTVGTPVPDGAGDGVNCLELLVGRIKGLVEQERAAAGAGEEGQGGAEEENPCTH